ncbi:sugar transferase [bacterium]|nr:MAG: sugar transferase [bacterium]
MSEVLLQERIAEVPFVRQSQNEKLIDIPVFSSGESDWQAKYWIMLYARKYSQSNYMKFKYLTSQLIGLLALVLLTPVLLSVAFIIKLDSRGPVFFKQKRFGFMGKSFTLYKFRTMIQDAHLMQEQYAHLNEMNGGRLFKSDKDPRITRLGRFLRKLSIDELPQLINIVKGDMTIIGPRPISTPLNCYTEENLLRFTVKPGLGAIWQAYHRGETDFDKWVKMDCLYVKNVSFLLDVKLFFTILFNVLRARGAR